jgi:hypothetical protein
LSLRPIQAEYLYTRFGNSCPSSVCSDNNWSDPLNWHTRDGHTFREGEREWREESDIPGSSSAWLWSA